MSAATSRHARPYNQLENLASEEAAKIARGMDTLPDPYAAERPLERTNRVSFSQKRSGKAGTECGGRAVTHADCVKSAGLYS